MQTSQPAYFSQYRSLKVTRDFQSVLVVEFHSNGQRDCGGRECDFT
jgi:hypothetical protein